MGESRSDLAFIMNATWLINVNWVSISSRKTVTHVQREKSRVVIFLLMSEKMLMPGKLGPLHTRDWEPVTVTLEALSLGGKAGLVQVCFTLRLRDQRSMWMQDECKVYVDSYMASNGPCFMITWTIYKNRFLGVGLTQDWETMALRTFTTIDLFYFIMCEEPHE